MSLSSEVLIPYHGVSHVGSTGLKCQGFMLFRYCVSKVYSRSRCSDWATGFGFRHRQGFHLIQKRSDTL
jgi:hypothetical protein